MITIKTYRSKLLILLCFVLLVCFVGPACTGTGHLQKGEQLYTGAKIKIRKEPNIGSTKLLKTDLKKSLTLPRPNKKILWMRPKLILYGMFKNSREKSFGSFVANRLGEPPVLYEPKIIGRHRELLTERASNDGYFKTRISVTEKEKKRRMKLVYEVQVMQPREILEKVVYPPDSTNILDQTLHRLQSSSMVNPGNPYHLEDLIGERQRLTDTLRNQGWYFFSPDNLVFEADTLSPTGHVNLRLKVKPETGEKERKRYRLASVTIYPDYDLASQKDSTFQTGDTLRFDDCTNFVYKRLPTKPEVIKRQIFLRCGRYYSNRAYQATIYRLLNLNLYKFVNIRYDISPQSDTLLDARIYLTPYRPERVEATVSGVFSPGFYAGVRLGTAYSHRNTFRGAEGLRVALNGAYLRTNKENFDFEYFLVSDATAGLSIPKFLFLKEKQNRAFNSTLFTLRHETNSFLYVLPELGRFRLSFQRIGAQGGYLWKKNRRGSVIQEINPLNVGVQFSTINNDNIRSQLISQIPQDSTGATRSLLTFMEFKPNYTFTLDQRLEPARQHTKYFRQRFAVQTSRYTRSRYLPSEYTLESPLNLFIESDYRQYQNTHKRNILAFRAAVGAGIPLRPNGTVALLDRYVIGGASSVRAFAPRTVGPGSEPRVVNNGTLDVGRFTGNLLIETSLEYRMPLGKYPELAVFVDAGNIWLTSGPDATDASKFHFNRFYKELAVGGGAGLRVNLGFFVVRLDLAFPFNRPDLPNGQRWVVDDLHLSDLNWNFSFGYPF